jgi:KUP system potassium uptake protein
MSSVPQSHGAPGSVRRQIGLTVGALGVVFGDIGTSPLYAMKQSALAAGGAVPGIAAVMGVLSLIFGRC